ncbi:MAG: LegC family aminotransferase [Candidatus Omnitrophica bacterium]|nr:LegC family aminotransferase [Candidatus Omnitrophota bacterium]
MNYKIPLSVPVANGNEWKYVKECLDTAWLASGKFVDKFEKAICQYTKAKFAIACINGTSGLQLALRLSGVKTNDEIIVPTLTFIAPVNVISYLGAEPVFMDCDDYMNLDVEKLNQFCKDECKLTKSGLRNKRTGRIIRAVVPVHIFGNPCDMTNIMKIAHKYNLKVIEDAAESLGSYFKGGLYKNRFTGTIGDFGVYSFNGNKIITTGGGGMLVTNNRKLAEKARYFATQAKNDPINYVHSEIGYNFRLSNIQSALGIAQLERLENVIKIKKKNYDLYKKELSDICEVELLGAPEDTRPNYWFYSLIIEKKMCGMGKEGLTRRFLENGIQARPIWYLNHMQKPYRNKQAFKIEKAIWFWKRTLNMPCSPNLAEKEIKKISSIIKNKNTKR